MKTVLIAKDLQPYLLPALQFLRRSDIVNLAGSTAEELVTLHFEHQSSLIITHLELPGIACESFVNVIRQSKVLRSVSILLLTDGDGQRTERAFRCGANAVLSRDTHPRLLGEKIQELLGVPPRRSCRIILNLSVDSTHGGITFPCSMENLSANGMLISTPQLLSPGDRIHCRFALPEGFSVVADGEVVRAADGAPGSAPKRYGIHFLKIAQDAEARIAAFVDSEVLRLRDSGVLDPTHGI